MSPCITLLADASTDIANQKNMTINARICDPNTSKPETIFLRNVEYEDGSGLGLTNQLVQEITNRNIDVRKITGFGSDGASVMTGLDKGVNGRMRALHPHIIHVYCLSLRLALCTSQAAAEIKQLKKYQECLTNLFYYFKASASREQELHRIQAILNHPPLKYKEIHAVRWLSFNEALEAVIRTMDPLLTYLHNRVASKDPKAKGLLKVMASREFIYTTYMMMDVMSLASLLCLTFQNKDLDVAKAKVGKSISQSGYISLHCE